MIYIPTLEEADMRIDRFLAERQSDLSRSAIQKSIEDGLVLVNGKPVAKSYRIGEDDEITVAFREPVAVDILPENIPLDIVYEDSDLLVVNKPKGMVVHPAPGNHSGTLVNALMYHCGDSLSGINGELRPGIVHRIDKDTSGLLLVAKNDRAHQGLAEQIAEHSCQRIYEAIVNGKMSENSGTVDAPIARHPVERKRMAVVSGGKNAVTHWEKLEDLGAFSHLSLRLETGRTHQIRVHMSHIGHPLYGDTLYGGGRTKSEKQNETLVSGQCLHARQIGFVHPVTGKEYLFTSELPPYFAEILRKLRENQ